MTTMIITLVTLFATVGRHHYLASHCGLGHSCSEWHQHETRDCNKQENVNASQNSDMYNFSSNK